MELATACRCSCALQEVERLLVMRMGITMTRYDVYYVNLHCANHADLGGNLNMRVGRDSCKKPQKQA